MKDAGMTVVRAEGLLDADTVRWLERLPKHERSVEVGRLSRASSEGRRGPSLSELITRGIAARVDRMLQANRIGPENLLSVKRDAVFVTGPAPSLLHFEDGTRFRVKNTYAAYARLGAVEVYCTPRTGRWDVKGIADERKRLHGPVAGFVMDLLGVAARDRVDAADTVRIFREDYVGLRLPVGFYREFNAGGSYSVRARGAVFQVEGADDAFPKAELEVMFNLRNVVIPLARFLA